MIQDVEHALVVADRSGTIRHWNDAATELFGHAAIDAIAASLDLIVPVEFRERHWVGYRRAWTDGIDDAPRVAMMPVLCADGEVRRFAGHLLPVKGPHGGLAAMAGIYSAPAEADSRLFVMS